MKKEIYILKQENYLDKEIDDLSLCDYYIYMLAQDLNNLLINIDDILLYVVYKDDIKLTNIENNSIMSIKYNKEEIMNIDELLSLGKEVEGYDKYIVSYDNKYFEIIGNKFEEVKLTDSGFVSVERQDKDKWNFIAVKGDI